MPVLTSLVQTQLLTQQMGLRLNGGAQSQIIVQEGGCNCVKRAVTVCANVVELGSNKGSSSCATVQA